MWSLLHVPCVNVPGLTGPAGLPVGVTVTGPRFLDRHVLQVASRLGAVLARG
jgi:Asp-tRNA(Asn)/Glu-tRNA(Gln) amidotransferase A subunit family amidase